MAGQGPGLLGRNWLQHTTLNWKLIKAVSVQPEEVSELSDLLNQYEDVFKDSLGTIEHHEACKMLSCSFSRLDLSHIH